MIYKAIMLDIDGTVIPYSYDSLSSKRVIEAVEKAKAFVSVCIVTGRSYIATKIILESFDIHTGYAVVDGGAFVVDLESKKTIYEKFLTKDDLRKIAEVFEKEKVVFYLKDRESFAGKRDYYEPYKKGQVLTDVSMIFTDELFSLERTHAIMKKLSSPTTTIFRSKHKDPNKYSFNITHVKATKMHGIAIIAKMLKLKKEEIIGVGDGYNDYPLLMGSGLKVAMGNAVNDLKEIADFVAPSVEDDGVAVTIEKFILPQP